MYAPTVSQELSSRRDLDPAAFLDRVRLRILAEPDVGPAIEQLRSWLEGLYRTSSWSQWRELADGVCRSHPLTEVLHEDPFMKRAYSKPRGYPADPILLDFIYRTPSTRTLLRRACRI